MKFTPIKNTKKTPLIPTAVAVEMRRLAKIHPLLSPTAGWPKLKGLHATETTLNLCLDAPVHPALNSERVNPLWALDVDPAAREDVARALRGLLSTVGKMATAALKPAGWKLKAIDQRNTHALAMLWTRKGREVALLAYAERRLPGIGWRNTGMKRDWTPSEPNVYHTDVRFTLATPKRSPEVLAEVCAALSRVIGMRRDLAKFKIPSEHGWTSLHGMPQVHICRSAREDGLAPQHRKLIDSLRGKVCLVGFDYRRVGGTADMRGHVIEPAPQPTRGAEESWAVMSSLQAGSIRLVAVDDQGRLKWCETFGRGETVPTATVKRLLASSHYSCGAPWSEQEAIYRSTKA